MTRRIRRIRRITIGDVIRFTCRGCHRLVEFRPLDEAGEQLAAEYLEHRRCNTCAFGQVMDRVMGREVRG